MWDKIRQWASELTSPLQEALKEAFRVTLFSLPGQLIVFLDRKDIQFEVFCINLLVIFLRSLDKYIHEKSKLRGPAGNTMPSGISPI